MGTSNFLQFNPTQANQETDTQYLIDATRTGGAGVDAIWPSPSANKTLYQATTFVAAFGQMMANKGFTVSDAVLSTLTAQLSNVLTTADVRGNLQSVPWAATLVLDMAQYLGFQVTLTGNTTLSVSGQQVGDVVTILYVQDSSGGHSVSFDGGDFAGGAFEPDPTPNTVSAQVFKVNASLALVPVGPLISPTGINGTPIGTAVPAAGNFTILTASTPSVSDNSTRAATTAWCFAGFAISLGAAGYLKLPNWLGGWMIQWKEGPVVSSSGASTTVSFPTAFPTACLFTFVSTHNASPTDTNMSFFQWVSSTASAATVFMMRNADHSYDAISPLIIAIGN